MAEDIEESSYSEIEDEIYDTAHEIRPAKANDFRSPGGRNHEKLCELFTSCKHDDEIFLSLLCLCDPKTQPAESSDYILSIQFLTEIFIGIVYCKIVEELESEEEPDFEITINAIKFKMSIRLFGILIKVIEYLGISNDEELHYLQNLQTQDNLKNLNGWENELANWGPKTVLNQDLFNLKLTYLMGVILLNSLNCLFVDEHGNQNLSFNPYTSKFTELWKYYTEMLKMALIIDKYLEDKDLETPLNLVEILKGTSLIRYILGYILNQSYYYSNPNYKIDLNEKSLLDIYDPINRDNINGGAITKVIHYYEFLQLINELPGDKTIEPQLFNEKYATFDTHDEDVRYIFDYDSAEELLEIEDQEEADDDEDDAADDDDGYPQDIIDIDMELIHQGNNITTHETNELYKRVITSVKQFINGRFFEERFENDEEDEWSDTPKGENTKFQLWCKDLILSNINFELENINELIQLEDNMFVSDYFIKGLDSLIKGTFDKEYVPFAQELLYKISECTYKKKIFMIPESFTLVLFDYLFDEALEEKFESLIHKNLIIPVYSIKNFELLFIMDPELAKKIIIELFFVDNKRRLLIWRLCHEINLSHNLIDFICQLLIGFPLNNSKRSKNDDLKFSRCGSCLVLSEVEKSMLLNEFIESSLEFLSASNGIENNEGYEFTLSPTVVNKLVYLICLLINKLIKEKILYINDNEIDNNINNGGNNKNGSPRISAIHSIVGFLFNYISKVPMARTLYFQVLNLIKSKDENANANPDTTTNSSLSSEIPHHKVTKSKKTEFESINKLIIDVYKKSKLIDGNKQLPKMSSDYDSIEVIADFMEYFPKISEDSSLWLQIDKLQDKQDLVNNEGTESDVDHHNVTQNEQNKDQKSKKKKKKGKKKK